MNNSNNLNRLRWKCRRGMLELDLMLLKFLDERYSTLTPKEQTQFEQLLEMPDPVLQEYLYGISIPEEAEIKKIIEKIRF